jgi:phosphoribosylpyrophosphate synthetase
VVTVDLPPQVQGFFKVPVDDLYAMPILSAEAKNWDDQSDRRFPMSACQEARGNTP